VPKILEPIRCQLGVARGVLDVAVAQVLLDRPRVLSIVRQFVARGMAQHVRMHREGKARLPSSAPDDLAHGSGGERCRALTDEEVGCLRVRPLEATEGAQLWSASRVDGGEAVLEPRYVEQPLREVDLLPAPSLPRCRQVCLKRVLHAVPICLLQTSLNVGHKVRGFAQHAKDGIHT